MSNELPVLTSLTENSTDLPVSAGRVENYVLLLVLLCVFAGGTLVLLSLLLLFCHHCCVGGRHYSRGSNDPEKTNTTYVEDSQPTQEITIRLDESDTASTICHDGETDHFLSTGSTGRRVSFNESALYEQERKNQDKGRRYTLTEGDFHHLKKARLTHLHLAPPLSALNILTIMECESAGSSTLNINETPAPKPPLVIYQPPERGLSPVSHIWLGQSLSGGLPGEPHHAIILDQGPPHKLPALKPQHSRTRNVEAIGDRGEGERKMKGRRGMSLPAGQTPVLQFFSKLRRHASLEGAGPYFRKWKFDSSHRAASLDAKGSPKRKPFQRQRAASETTDHTEEDLSPLSDEIPQVFPHSASRTSNLQPLSAGSLFPATSPLSPPGTLCRLEVEAVVEAGVSNNTSSAEAHRTQPPSGHPETQQRDMETGPRREATTGVGEETEAEAAGGSAGVWGRPGQDEGGRIPVEVGDRCCDTAESLEDGDEDYGTEGMLGSGVKGQRREEGGAGMGATSGAEVLGAEGRTGPDSGSPLHCLGRRESGETAPSLYRDIWSLRASLEQCASSDQSSTDRESIRSDADSVCSLGGAGARSGCLSQDLDDEPEREGEEADGGDRGASGGDTESGSSAGGGEGEAGSRKLLQMDSGYASIEAPSRAPEELRLFGAPGCPRSKTASERRLFFTSSRRKGSVCESSQPRVFQEELEDEITDGAETLERPVERGLLVRLPVSQEPTQLLKPPHPQTPLDTPQATQLYSQPPSPTPQPPPPPLPQPSPHRPRLRRRDYSIDEKTDALFSEFLRHDPRFDQEDSPLRSRHRSRVHLRKQWQRHKQYSDPGAGTGGRYSPSLERQRFSPLRRGDSAGYPMDTRYHSTLSRIASAADEEASETAAGGGDAACAESANEDEAGEGATAGLGGASGDVSSAVGRDSAAAASAGSEGLASHSCDTLSRMDPKVDNRNNNSSQAISSEMASSLLSPRSTQKPSATSPEPLIDCSHVPPAPALARPILKPQSSLTDKLAVTLEERLFSGLRTGQHLGRGQGGLEAVVTVSHTSSPDRSPT